MPDIIEKNSPTLETVKLVFYLDGKVPMKKRFRLGPAILRKLEKIRDVMTRRDGYIQNLMVIMDDSFEKEWKLPAVSFLKEGKLMH